MTHQTEALAEPLVPGSDRHLHILLAAANLNLVVGDDFKSLMEFGRLVWSAALSSQPPAPIPKDEMLSQPDLYEVLRGSGYLTSNQASELAYTILRRASLTGTASTQEQT